METALINQLSELSDDSESLMECVEDPLAETHKLPIEEISNSDSEDFFGFEVTDLNNEKVNSLAREVNVEKVESDITQNTQSVSKEADDDVILIENNVEVIEIDDNERSPLEPKETDDEIIIVENTVEVIEIDDDDDNEVILFTYSYDLELNIEIIFRYLHLYNFLSHNNFAVLVIPLCLFLTTVLKVVQIVCLSEAKEFSVSFSHFWTPLN